MKKKQRSQTSVVGGSSLLVIFSVLCVAIFALMSLSSAQSDTRLNERGLQAVQGYYAADCEAEHILAALRSGEIPDGVREDNGIYYFDCPISETQQLSAAVRVEGNDYEILHWQAGSSVAWELDEHINVWDGILS